MGITGSHCEKLIVHPWLSQVQQRGVEGTAAILEALISGLEMRGHRTYVLDLMPNRQSV